MVARSATCHFLRSCRHPHIGRAGLLIFMVRFSPERSSEIPHGVTLASGSNPMTRRNAAVQTGGQTRSLHYLLDSFASLRQVV
jgi:hypothetical protein